MRVHELKSWEVPFQAILDGKKRFEFRRYDRNFRVGDMLWLREYSPRTGEYSGRCIHQMVTYVMFVGRYVVMSIQPPTEAQSAESVELQGALAYPELSGAIMNGVEAADNAMGMSPDWPPRS